MESDYFCLAIAPKYGIFGGKLTEKRVPSELKNPPLNWGTKSIKMNNQGTILFSSGNYEEALKAFESATTVMDFQNVGPDVQFVSDNRFEVAWFNKANTLGNLKRYDKAVNAFDRAIELNPTRSESKNPRDMTKNLRDREKENNKNSTDKIFEDLDLMDYDHK
jgi:tetratricopeptide (TPR) repeat protein